MQIKNGKKKGESSTTTSTTRQFAKNETTTSRFRHDFFVFGLFFFDSI